MPVSWHRKIAKNTLHLFSGGILCHVSHVPDRGGAQACSGSQVTQGYSLGAAVLSRLPKHWQSVPFCGVWTTSQHPSFGLNPNKINSEVSKFSARHNHLYYRPQSQGWENRHFTVTQAFLFIFLWGQILTFYFTFNLHFSSDKAWFLKRKRFWIETLEHQLSQNKVGHMVVFLSSQSVLSYRNIPNWIQSSLICTGQRFQVTQQHRWKRYYEEDELLVIMHMWGAVMN